MTTWDDLDGFMQEKPMSKEIVTEWAIQDEATGAWMTTSGVFQHATTYIFKGAYYDCAKKYLDGYPNARIVPAPPREMTDAECVAWLEAVTLIVPGDGSSGINGIRFIPYYDALGRRCERGSWHVKHQDGSSAGCAEGFFDAIRAARKKLEEK